MYNKFLGILHQQKFVMVPNFVDEFLEEKKSNGGKKLIHACKGKVTTTVTVKLVAYT